MSLSEVVLGLLADEPDHAYRLKRRISPGLPPERLVNDGVLYPLLAKLEREKLIAGRDETKGARRRRVFRTTAAGRRRFREWLLSDAGEDSGPSYDSFTSHPLVKLLFSSHLDEEQRLAKLRGYAARAGERLRVLERLRAEPGEEDSLNLAWLDLELEQQRVLTARLEQLVAACERGGPGL